MKYILIVGDGMSDFPIPSLDGKTPLEYAAPRGMARLSGGRLGRVRTCPEALPPGSDVAFLSLMGHDPVKCYTGRSPLEAAGEQVMLAEDEVSFRINLISIAGAYPSGRMESYNGDGIEGEDALNLMRDLIADKEFAFLMRRFGMSITPTDTFRHIAVMKADNTPFKLTPAHDIAGRVLEGYLPRGQKARELHILQECAHRVLSMHPINRRRIREGKKMANGIWFWGDGRAAKLGNFTEKYGRSGSVISAVPLVRGIAWLSGLKAPRIEGATGTLDTNYEGKVSAALDALRGGDDFVLLHLEAPDDMSHLGDAQGKVESIRRLDERMVQPVLKALDEMDEPYRVLLMPDHYTLLSTMTHDGTPAPFALYDSRVRTEPRAFTESACSGKTVFESGDALMRLFLDENDKESRGEMNLASEKMYELDDSSYITHFSKDAEPVLTVPDGAVVRVRTIDCYMNNLREENDPRGAAKGVVNSCNPATGPIYIEGAKAGDTLKCEILDIEVDEYASMRIRPGAGFMGDKVTKKLVRAVPIRDGFAALAGVRIPVEPMIGVIGAAPAGDPVDTETPHNHGGNMDNRMIRAGSTLYLPVHADGALFALGDVHAQMGDGEVGLCGMECPAYVTVRLSVIHGRQEDMPVLEYKGSFQTIASAETLDRASKQASDAMLDFLEKRTDIERNDLIMVMGQICDLAICQVVDPLLTVRMTLRSGILDIKF